MHKNTSKLGKCPKGWDHLFSGVVGKEVASLLSESRFARIIAGHDMREGVHHVLCRVQVLL